VDGVVEAFLNLGKVSLNVFGAPRFVAGELGDLIPIRVIGTYDDHCVVRRASAERGGAGIENAALAWSAFSRRVASSAILGVHALTGVILVVTDREVPAYRRVFGCRRVIGRHMIDFAHAVRLRAAALYWIDPGLDEQHPPTVQGQP